MVYGDDALAVEFLNDFIIMQEMKWKPKDIEQLTEFQYEAILATTQTLSSLRKLEAEKRKGSGAKK